MYQGTIFNEVIIIVYKGGSDWLIEQVSIDSLLATVYNIRQDTVDQL